MSQARNEFKIEIPTLASIKDANAYRHLFYGDSKSFNLPSEMASPATSNFVFLRNAENEICGGAFIQFSYDILVVESIWIRRELRKQGHGQRLYRAIEDLAYLKKKKRAVISTFEFQAAIPFWKRLGFTEFGQLPGGAAGSTLIYMSKMIESENRQTRELKS